MWITEIAISVSFGTLILSPNSSLGQFQLILVLPSIPFTHWGPAASPGSLLERQNLAGRGYFYGQISPVTCELLLVWFFKNF